MSKVVPKIEKTSELVDYIVHSSTEQLGGIEQINNAMDQLSNVTQQNVNNSELLASSADELSAQAVQLNNSISFFKTAEYELNKSKTSKQQVFEEQLSTSNEQTIRKENTLSKPENDKIIEHKIDQKEDFTDLSSEKGFKLKLDDEDFDDSEFESF